MCHGRHRTVAALTAVDQDLELLSEGDDSGDDTTDESSGVTDGTTPADGTSESDGDSESGDGTGGPDSRKDRRNDATLATLILLVMGMASLLVFAVLSTGQRWGR